MNNLTSRLLVSLVVTIFILLAIYFSAFTLFRPVFTLITAAFIGAALWEFYHIAKGKGFDPLSGLGIIGSIAFVYISFLATEHPNYDVVPFALLITLVMIGFGIFFYSRSQPLVNLSITFFGLLYLTIPLSLMIPINFDYGRRYLIYLIMVTKFTDIGAYFIGSYFGKTKLAPYISPKKSWEGAIGGFLIGVLASFLFTLFYPKLDISLGESLLLGSLISIAAQFGDLTESLLKRDMGVKDSNHLPGLGGMLDVVDSLVFTTPLLYFYLKRGF